MKIEEIQAAWGIHELVNETMAAAARIKLSERGKDPRNFTLMATGGAGPVHAFRLARKVGLKRIVCPPGAGLASSLGLHTVPFKVDTVDSQVMLLEDVNLTKLNDTLISREKRLREVLTDAGVREREIRIQRMADISFEGQGFPLTIPIPSGKLTRNHFGEISETYREHYASAHGRAIDEVPLQVFSWRIFGMGPEPNVSFDFSNLPEKKREKRLEGQPAHLHAGKQGFPKGKYLRPLSVEAGTEVQGAGVGGRENDDDRHRAALEFPGR